MDCIYTLFLVKELLPYAYMKITHVENVQSIVRSGVC